MNFFSVGAWVLIFTSLFIKDQPCVTVNCFASMLATLALIYADALSFGPESKVIAFIALFASCIMIFVSGKDDWLAQQEEDDDDDEDNWEDEE